MNFKDAAKDGVKFEKSKTGQYWFYPACHLCGSTVITPYYKSGAVYTCKDCKANLAVIEKERLKSLDRTKRINQLNYAIKRISHIANLDGYKNAIEKIKKTIDDDVWFSSTEEVMVALQLEKKGIKYEIQKPIGPYTVDFYLKDENLAIEIDGLFHTKEKKEKENWRDDFIKRKTGIDVMRIKTDYVNHNVTRITPAIKIWLKRSRCEDYKEELEKVKKWREPLYHQINDFVEKTGIY